MCKTLFLKLFHFCSRAKDNNIKNLAVVSSFMLLSTSPFYIRLVLTIRTVPQLRCDQIVSLSSWTLSVSELNQGILM